MFGASWLGNLLLTGLGFFLAFTQAEPLTVGLFATAAACILSGNTLPIGAYALYLYGQRTQIQAEQNQASVTVRESLRRSEAVLQRLEAAEGAIAKSLLLARQLPEKLLQVQGGQEMLLEAMDAFDANQLTEVAARLDAFKASREEGPSELLGCLESLEALVKAHGANLIAVDKRLGALVETGKGERSEDDTGVLERLDLLQEALEGVEHSLDGLLLAVGTKSEAASVDSAPLPLPDEPVAQPESVKSSAMRADPEGEDSPETADSLEASLGRLEAIEASEASDEGADEPESNSDAAPSEDKRSKNEAPEPLFPEEEPVPHEPAEEVAEEVAEEPVLLARELPVEESSPLTGAKTKREKAPVEKPPSRRTVAQESQFEMGFEDFGETAGAKVRPDQVILRVKSMVGIQNKVFIRGDEPHLSWEAGQRMDVVGIGEFFIKFDGVNEPFGAAFWLNDEVEADSGPVRLEPGQRYELAVRFRR